MKVEESRPAVDGRPSAGPVYRSIYAKDGLMELPEGLESPWQFLRYISHPILKLLAVVACVVRYLCNGVNNLR